MNRYHTPGRRGNKVCVQRLAGGLDSPAAIFKKHESCGAPGQLVLGFPSPPSGRGSVEIAAQIDRQDDHANKHGAANDEPLGQIGIYNCVENVEEKRSARGFDACAIFEPRFSDGEWAWRPRNQLDDNGVDERSDVEGAQKRAATCDRSSPARPRRTKAGAGTGRFPREQMLKQWNSYSTSPAAIPIFSI